MGYTIKCRVIRCDDAVPTVGHDRYGAYVANDRYWGTTDDLYYCGHLKPNHPVPALTGQLSFDFCFNHGWFHAYFGEQHANH